MTQIYYLGPTLEELNQFIENKIKHDPKDIDKKLTFPVFGFYNYDSYISSKINYYVEVIINVKINGELKESVTLKIFIFSPENSIRYCNAKVYNFIDGYLVAYSEQVDKLINSSQDIVDITWDMNKIDQVS